MKKKKWMKKWQTENSESSEISEILEILFRVFLFPSFWFCPTVKIENTDSKISEKNFRDLRDFRGFEFLTWPQPPSYCTQMHELEKLAVVNTNKGLAERFSDLVDTIHGEFNRRMTKLSRNFWIWKMINKVKVTFMKKNKTVKIVQKPRLCI